MMDQQSLYNVFLFECLALLSNCVFSFFLFLQHRKIYKMKNIPHGYCLILNNYIFKNPSHNREGTLQDGGKYFLNPITDLVFFSDNSPKQSSNLCCEDESCPWYTLASRDWRESLYQLDISHFQHLADALKKDLLFVPGKRHCLNCLYVQLVKKWLFHLSNFWLFFSS